MAARRHGFEPPFHPAQLLSWVVFVLDVSVFCAIVIPLFSELHWRVLVACVYAASVSALVAAAFVATSCDPSDPQLLAPPLLEQDEDKFAFCNVCASHVHPRSKHCHLCGKCASGFDHHCIWLNNCIGAANYRSFACAVASAAMMTGVISATSAYFAREMFFDIDAFEVRCHDHAFGADADAAGGFICVLLFVNLPLFVLDSQLIVLHVFLLSQNLTTYEYVMGKHHMEKELKAGDKLTHSIRTLPRCLDWIVFRRGKKRSRGKKTDDVETFESPPHAPEVTSAPGFETEEAERQVDWGASPPPPGCICTDAVPANDSHGGVDAVSPDNPQAFESAGSGGCSESQRTPVTFLLNSSEADSSSVPVGA